MEGSNRRKFSREFKLEAVRMVNEGNRSINQVARDLDLHANVLGRWKRQLSDDPKNAFPGKGKLKEPDEENRRLRRELERLRMERDILKSHQYLFQRKRVRFRFIDYHRGIWPLITMCRVLRVTAQGYYAWKNRPESQRSKANRELLTEIRVAYEASRKTYGSTRIHAELVARGEDCSRGRVARLMRRHGIRARQKRKFRITTDSRHKLPVVANVLGRNFETARADTVWAADITFAHP